MSHPDADLNSSEAGHCLPAWTLGTSPGRRFEEQGALRVGVGPARAVCLRLATTSAEPIDSAITRTCAASKGGSAMALRIKSSQDFWTGCAFMAFGAATVVLAQALSAGQRRAHGTGVFPDGARRCCWPAIGLVIAAQIAGPRRWRRRRARPHLAAAARAAGRGGVRLAAQSARPRAHGRHCRDAGGLGRPRVPLRRGAARRTSVLALLSYAAVHRGLNQTMPVWPWFLRSDARASHGGMGSLRQSRARSRDRGDACRTCSTASSACCSAR